MSHQTYVRIYFQDTDAGGIVYHSNYLDYAERARSEFLYDLGLSNGALIEKGVAFVLRRVEIDYKAPARLDDLLTIETSVLQIKNASMMMRQVVSKEGKELVVLTLQLAFVNPKTLTPVRLPADLKDLFSTHLKGENNAI